MIIKRSSDEKGVVAIIVGILLTVIVSFAAFAVDIGLALMEQRRINAAADAAAITGVGYFYNPSYEALSGVDEVAAANSVATEVTAIAVQNGLDPSEIDTANGGVQTGQWIDTDGDEVGDTFSATTSSPNAVRVAVRRTTPAGFSKIFGISSLQPREHAVATMGTADSADCVIPFALELPLVQTLDYGDEVSIGSPSPGNWGKINHGGNMSSKKNFEDAMTGSNCGSPVKVGDQMDPGTGFAFVVGGFDLRLAQNPIVTMLVVDEFPSGKSKKVTVEGFIVVEILGAGKSGKNWSGDIKIIEGFTSSQPGGSTGGGPFALSRFMVE